MIAGSSNLMCPIVSHDSIQDKCSTGQILLNISYITGYPKLKAHHYYPLQVIEHTVSTSRKFVGSVTPDNLTAYMLLWTQ